MQPIITGKNFDITPALKNFVNEKFESYEDRFKKITTMHVVLSIEHIDHIAEATVHINGIDVHATAQSDDMYKAIEALSKKMTEQLTKHKEKVIESHRS